MNGTSAPDPAGVVGGNGEGAVAAGSMADRLSLAAAPTFAVMALLTAASGGPEMGCMAAPDAWPIGGMVPMYLLMSAFHAAPWLRLLARRRHQEPPLPP